MSLSRGALAAGAAVTAAAAVTLTVVLWPDSSDPARRSGSQTSPGATSAAPTPSPTRSYPLSKTPRTIPAVREHTPAHGPGWRPGKGSAVVIADGSKGLADEGRLLAGELKIGYRGEAAARAGDVELALTPTAEGGPESYTLKTHDGRVTISGPGQAGVFYGTRTLKQSVRADGSMPEGEVRDRPDRPQRGLNLDIARKFYSVGWIEDRLRDMADLKLNQLGLHFSDDQAFRVESDTHPEIVSPEHLTKAQVRQIVALAGRLHIQVVPEIDSPGHLGAVLRAHPDLQLRNVSGVASQGSLDISKPGAAKLVDELLNEYTELFPGTYWHLGADEYLALMARDPAASYPQLQAAAVRKYGPKAGIADLATGWLNDRAAVVRPHGKQPKAWNDGLFRDSVVKAAKNIEIEYWTGKEYGARQPDEYLREGRQMLNLNDEFLYYVLGQPNDFVYPTGKRIYEQWTPLVMRGTTPVPARYSRQILGGRFAVWGDLPNAQTAAQVAQGIRMPLRATSQKLWDPGKPKLGWDGFRKLAGEIDKG
ncbi:MULTISPECIES: glycoside hydrolase family 20 protein [unclassified Streptomyces]|uniref:beta-N-acetylhexosaminidase n=1 Tax=unclassified Streptomyces TaxID=2593676 RepID=UPI00093C8AE8|nr:MULTISPECIES: glycoside hydrolase family 20 protein [unclassified Streptomyces]OKK24723.1 beta-N-acetylglucosaminidase [Streptomyces sp. CB02488]WSJ24780.1 family 20 glycosylhydrolase [Streptomyces sp. NBC_01324]